MIKAIGLLALVWSVAAISFYAGRESVEQVKQIDKVCPEQKEKLISSSHSHTGTICVYQEPWKIKGKVKRIEL
jgi:hypothetical protein